MSHMKNFTVIKKFMFQTSPLIIIMPCFRIPSRNYEYFLVMFFATDEINKNPYLLPNTSLIFSTILGQIEDTLGVLDILHSQLLTIRYYNLINYICRKVDTCDVELTGPSWKMSLKLASDSSTPKVRICDTDE